MARKWQALAGARTWAKTLGALAVAGLLLLFVLMGVAAVAKGVDMLREASAVSATERTTVGTVIARSSESGGGPGTRIERMTVEYSVEATQYRIEVSGDDPVGSDVTVRFDPDHPEKPITTSVSAHRVSAVLGILIGIALALGPLGLTLKLAREAWRERAKS